PRAMQWTAVTDPTPGAVRTLLSSPRSTAVRTASVVFADRPGSLDPQPARTAAAARPEPSRRALQRTTVRIVSSLRVRHESRPRRAGARRGRPWPRFAPDGVARPPDQARPGL